MDVNKNNNQDPNQSKDDYGSIDYAKTIEALNNTIEELKNKLGETADKKIVDEITEKINKLTETVNALVAKEEELKRKEQEIILKNMSETERLKHLLDQKESEIEKIKKELEESFGKKTKELEEKLKLYEEEKQKLMQATTKAKTLEAATRFGAYNPDQVFAIVRDYLVAGEDGNVYARVPDGSGGFKQVPIDEYIKDFLSRPENKNLVKTNAGISQNLDQNTDDIEGSNPPDSGKSGLDKLPKAEREQIIAEATLLRISPEELFNIKQAKKKAYERWRKRHQRGGN